MPKDPLRLAGTDGILHYTPYSTPAPSLHDLVKRLLRAWVTRLKKSEISKRPFGLKSALPPLTCIHMDDE